MEPSGIRRPVDKMGRVVIPKEIRKQLNIENNKDSFEIFLEGDMVVLKKYNSKCIFCKSLKDTIVYEGRVVCKECVEKMKLRADSQYA